jgi:hypothetical protein
MNLKNLFAIIPLTVALLCTTISAETIDLEVTFTQTDLSFAVRDGYDQVYMRGLDLTREPGQPQLPLMAARALIPPGTRIDGVEVLEMNLVDLPGSYDIFPAQPPQILSLSPADLAKVSFVEPQEELYRSLEPFPSQSVRFTGSGYLAGYHLADLEICPLVYLPAEKKLQFCRSIRFVVNTAPGGRTARPGGRRGEGDRQFYQALVKDLILNPSEAALMAPRSEKVSSKALSPGDYEYVIITMATYADEFQPLADWKGQKGVSDTVVTREWIEGSYSGYDVREQIRNFIIDAYQSWGTRWVLLGGDTNVIPSRTAYAMTCEAYIHAKEDSIRADLYFSDLDGDWDADGDHIYGELADSVDLYPDVFVGRASVSSQSEAQAWVDKVLLYEKTPQLDHPLKMLFLAEILWGFPTYTDGAVHKNMIDDQSVPIRFDPIKKLYHSLGNESADSARYYFNQGQNLVNHDGHCWYDVMSMGDGSFNRSDMDNLTNGTRPSILYSIGCWPAAFDFDCMAEHWSNNPDGGGVAFVGNNRYGWGSPGNPGYGYSDIFDTRFFYELFVSGQAHIGATLAAAKTYYVPKSRQENVYRIHQYQLNLLGDPEMPIWTDAPETLHVARSNQVPQGPVSFEVTVTDGSSPLDGALVCAASAGGLYQRGYTGANGQIVLALTVPSSDPVELTVTAQDFLPHVDSVTVLSEGAHIARLGYALNDSAGDGNGELNPGDIVDLSITLKNCGQDTAFAVSAVLRSSHELAAVLDSTGTYGHLSPDDTASSDYRVSFSADCDDGQVFYLDLEIQDDQAHTWHSTLGLISVEPMVVYLDCAADDGGNGMPEPGEEVYLDLTLQNVGSGTAPDVSARLSALDDYVAVLQDSAGYGLIEPESSAVSGTSYHLAIADSCPSRHLAPLRLDVTAGEEYASVDGLLLAIGTWGFADDMESGEGSWTHGGNKDHWHLSSHRSHSDSPSWYCGVDSTRQYEDGMNAYLLSPEIVLGPDSKLTFWTWYDVTIFGTDGLYVVVGKNAQWDTLDYIGSGGALDSLYMGNDWLPDEYDLSAYDTVQVKFIFKSNLNDHDAEGMYIDDVTIWGALMTLEDVVPPNPAINLTVILVDTALVLSWSPGDGEEVDHYVVYRDTLWDFQPTGANSLAMTVDTTYLDEDIGITGDAGRNHYYLIRAVDAMGKKSSPSEGVGEFDRDLGVAP